MIFLPDDEELDIYEVLALAWEDKNQVVLDWYKQKQKDKKQDIEDHLIQSDPEDLEKLRAKAQV